MEEFQKGSEINFSGYYRKQDEPNFSLNAHFGNQVFRSQPIFASPTNGSDKENGSSKVTAIDFPSTHRLGNGSGRETTVIEHGNEHGKAPGQSTDKQFLGQSALDLLKDLTKDLQKALDTKTTLSPSLNNPRETSQQTHVVPNHYFTPIAPAPRSAFVTYQSLGNLQEKKTVTFATNSDVPDSSNQKCLPARPKATKSFCQRTTDETSKPSMIHQQMPPDFEMRKKIHIRQSSLGTIELPKYSDSTMPLKSVTQSIGPFSLPTSSLYSEIGSHNQYFNKLPTESNFDVDYNTNHLSPSVNTTEINPLNADYIWSDVKKEELKSVAGSATYTNTPTNSTRLRSTSLTSPKADSIMTSSPLNQRNNVPGTYMPSSASSSAPRFRASSLENPQTDIKSNSSFRFEQSTDATKSSSKSSSVSSPPPPIPKNREAPLVGGTRYKCLLQRTKSHVEESSRRKKPPVYTREIEVSLDSHNDYETIYPVDANPREVSTSHQPRKPPKRKTSLNESKSPTSSKPHASNISSRSKNPPDGSYRQKNISVTPPTPRKKEKDPTLMSGSLLDIMHRRYYAHQYDEVLKKASDPILNRSCNKDPFKYDITSGGSKLPNYKESFDQATMSSNSTIGGEDSYCSHQRRNNRSNSLNNSDRSLIGSPYDNFHKHNDYDVDAACTWLKATGFPQYAQMFEDKQFPIDIASVREDHNFLDEDSLKALFRRLEILNNSTGLDQNSLEASNFSGEQKPESDEDEDEGNCALSDRWTFEQQTRRWSRVELEPSELIHILEPASLNNNTGKCSKSGKPQPLLLVPDANDSSKPSNNVPEKKPNSAPPQNSATPSKSVIRTASLRLRTAVTRFRRGDMPFRSLRRPKKADHHQQQQQQQTPMTGKSVTQKASSPLSNSSSTSPRSTVQISGPIVHNTPELLESIDRYKCLDLSPTEPEKCIQNSLSSNSVELGGESAQLNSRTGSFMVKCQRPAPPQLVIHPDDSPPQPRLPDSQVNNELDPVLELLMSDMNSIEHLRTTIRPGKCSGKYGAASAPASPLPNTEDKKDEEPQPSRFDAGSDFLQKLSEIDSLDLDRKISDLIKWEDSEKVAAEAASNDLRETTQPVSHMDHLDTATNVVLLAESSAGSEPLVKGSVGTGLPTDDDSSRCDSGLGSPSTTRRSESNGHFLPSTQTRNTPPTTINSSQQQVVLRSNTIQRTDRRYNRHSLCSMDREMSSMSIAHMAFLKKFAVLRLTTVMETHCPPNKTVFNWKFPKLLSQRTRSQCDITSGPGSLFGQPLAHWQRRYGHPLPPAIHSALSFLHESGPEAHGIFRRAGGKARTLSLREAIEKNHAFSDFGSWQPYDVADMLKQFFRELPECLLTNKLSTTLIGIFMHLPEDKRMNALQSVLISLPDENRTVFQSLLNFLNYLAQYDDVTQMNASNLAVCLSPSLFYFPHAIYVNSMSPRRARRATGGPDIKDLNDQKSAHECLALMITSAPKLFILSEDPFLSKLSSNDSLDPPPITDVIRGPDWQSWLQTGIITLLKEASPKSKGWTAASRETQRAYTFSQTSHIELLYRKVTAHADSVPLRTWRCSALVHACPLDVLNKIWDERSSWDPEISSTEVLEQLSDCVELYQTTDWSPSGRGELPRHTFLLRGRQSYLEQGGHVILSHSVRHPLHPDPKASVVSLVLAENVYIEPCIGHENLSRVCWISRVDIRGHSIEWYYTQWGHTLARRLIHLRNAFPGNQASPPWDTCFPDSLSTP